MNFSGGKRGVSGLIGFTLLFALVIILISIAQAQVVPAENSQKEFKHYVKAEGQVSELRSDYIDAAETGITRSTSTKLGTRYPSRILLVNSAPPTGRLRTHMPSNGTVTADGFNVSRVCGLESPVKTRSIAFDTRYNHFSDSEAPPYSFENTVLYSQAPDGRATFHSDQKLVQGSTINLYPLTSNMSMSGTEKKSIDFTGAETGQTKVDGSISVTVPTRLSGEQWKRLLADEPNFNSAQQVGSQRVKLVLSDTSWNVECAAVGGNQVPDVDSPAQIESGSNDSTGVGDGSVSSYNQNTSSDTFSLPNGRWLGITCTDQLIFSDGQPATRPNGNNLQGEIIRLSTLLKDSTGERYFVDVRLARTSDGSWNKKNVKIRDGDGNSVKAKLTAAAAARIYEGGEADLLELSNYDGPGTGSGSFSDFAKRIQRLEEDAPVTWQTSRMTGRVTTTLECDPPPAPPASGVSVIEETTPNSGSSALKFDMQVGSGTTRTVTSVSISTPGNQNSNVQSANQIKRSKGDEVILTASNTNGVNQSGSLKKNIKLDGTKYGLDVNAVFSSGAILKVDMSQIDGGNIKWKYSIADSEAQADVIVTFSFQNDTQFQVYLRVTNVNS